MYYLSNEQRIAQCKGQMSKKLLTKALLNAGVAKISIAA